ncbi:MAG: hypothetical protein ACOCXM_09580 [Myxococcota bacterium]
MISTDRGAFVSLGFELPAEAQRDRYADASRASYALERGRVDEAIAILKDLVPRQHGKVLGWADAYGPYARALLSKGRVQEAHRVLMEVTGEITPEQRQFVVNYLEPAGRPTKGLIA